MADLKFIVELQDKVSAIADKVNNAINHTKNKLNETSSAAEKLGPKINSAFTGVYNKAKQAAKGPEFLNDSVDDLRNKLEGVNNVRFNTVLSSEFKSATREAKKLERQISRLESGVASSGIGGKIAGWRKDFASALPGADLIKNPITIASAAIGGFWMATQKAMSAGKDKTKIQTLTGSKEIGGALYDGLTNFSVQNGLEGVYDLSARMLAQGIKSANILPIMNELGDISMGDAGKLDSLSNAFAKVSGNGRLMGEELNMMIDAGFNPLKVISDETGESVESLRVRMAKGEIGVDQIRKAMTSATSEGGDFYKVLENLQNTPEGKYRKLQGEIGLMFESIGDVFIPVAEGIMDFLLMLKQKAGPYLKPVVIALGGLATAILVAATAQWAFNAAQLASPITWIIVAVIALIAAITWLVTSITGWGEQWDNIVSYATDRWEMFKLVFTLVGQEIGHAFMTMVDGIVLAWKWGMNMIGQLSDEQFNKDVSRIGAEGKAREDAIKETMLAGNKLAKNMTDLEWKLGWKEDEKSVDGEFSQQENLMNQISAGGGKSMGKNAPDAKKTNTAIATGGTKNTTINLSLKNLIEVLNISSSGFKEGAKELETQSTDALLRTLAMANLAAE